MRVSESLPCSHLGKSNLGPSSRQGQDPTTPFTPNSPPFKSSGLAFYPPNVEGEKKKTSHPQRVPPRFPPTPSWSRQKTCYAQKQGKVFAVRNGSQLAPAGWTGRSSAKGRAGIPTLSETLAEGQRPQAHPRLRPWAKATCAGPLTLRGSKTLGRGQVIHSPTSRCLGSPWPRDDGSTPREAATPPAAFPPSESPLAQNT